ncbi:organoarsenical effux MFS transporter ArsJ [Porticoccus litoralis]|uniref:Organoarsenical effux MFS transporter ArsJ n=1 Tax=Porticoccus litoralis TaxID=434086 RepID=A0AAW8B3B4_9GAMM|nr:organoarsenical effux MFS transporter ArsJ [Porticoccus litoralis]MDP1519980.1 organoarsenical effux MFS transporter ArsJ [Porticoccus litoralis]TNE93648.1 MAG: MFS transporter [Gammaproteobacteria bacterium]
MSPLARLSQEVRQYLIVTGNYWAFTLTDGALRMLVVLHFHDLGYSPLEIALLFLFYEFFGVVTNLVGGWLGAHIGLNRTMNIGLLMQVVALAMLLVPATWLTVPWVMAAQALSGIAKDLNKMSAKSAIKLLVPKESMGTLYRWVALLTGSKNALKGAGFFLGGALLVLLGFRTTVASMAAGLTVVWLLSLLALRGELGTAKQKPKFTQLFSRSGPINYLSAARLCLFGARDVWFVVALPVYLSAALAWDHWQVGSFLALWIIGYGVIQSLAPLLTGRQRNRVPDGQTAFAWGLPLIAIPALIALAITLDWQANTVLVAGLMLFGMLFAINSSLHSYLIVSYAREDGVSLDVGFYYMANAMGRLLGTVLSGWLFQVSGLAACLWVSTLLIAAAAIISLRLPKRISGPEAT